MQLAPHAAAQGLVNHLVLLHPRLALERGGHDMRRVVIAVAAQILDGDLRGDGDHYAAHVVSATFRGKTRVQQHQMVYQALRGRMGNELHAMALQTSLPEGA